MMLDASAAGKRALLFLRQKGAAAYDRLRALTPARQRAARVAMANRRMATPLLDALSRQSPAQDATEQSYRRVLVDGMWDNPNFFLRYAMLRSALNLAKSEETGLFGRYRQREVAASFDMLGVARRLNFYDAVKPSQHRAEAHTLLRHVGTAEDLTRLDLPYDYPALLFYDGLLTRQRRGAADPKHPLLVDHLAEQLACLHAADALMRNAKFDLVALSHVLNFDFSSLAWAALRHGARIVVLYGDFGTARFIKVRQASDFFDYTNRPDAAEMDAAPPAFRARARERGGDYLDRRYRGASGDIGAEFAYRRAAGRIDRRSVCERFGFDTRRPLIAVYASNWFDFPHSCAMTNFLDFQDWIEATARVAAEVKSVNWLFKPHPCDDWYPSAKGPTLADIVRKVGASNVGLTDKSWNAFDLMQAIDGGITYHGTIGLELTAFGKPVLVADRGFYGDAGFVLHPGSRQAYLDALRRPWWREVDLAAASARAKEFAGWYFCPPDWHGSYVLPDDFEQDRIYETLPAFLATHRDAIRREIALIRDWFNAPSRFFHTYKVAREAAEWPRRAAIAGAN